MPGQAEGRKFQKGKNSKPKKEFAYRMRARANNECDAQNKFCVCTRLLVMCCHEMWYDVMWLVARWHEVVWLVERRREVR